MPVGTLAAFWLVAVVLIVVPGPDWAFTISTALSGRGVRAAETGLLVGYAAITAVVAAGVGSLVADSSAALTALTTAGGSYLIWRGGLTIARPAKPTAGRGIPGAAWRTVIRGIGVSGLNPKGLLIFLAVLPEFAAPHRAWPVWLQLAVLGLTFIVTHAVFYSCLAGLAGAVLRSRSYVARAVSRCSGLAMAGIGTFLLADRLLG